MSVWLFSFLKHLIASCSLDWKYQNKDHDILFLNLERTKYMKIIVSNLADMHRVYSESNGNASEVIMVAEKTTSVSQHDLKLSPVSFACWYKVNIIFGSLCCEKFLKNHSFFHTYYIKANK